MDATRTARPGRDHASRICTVGGCDVAEYARRLCGKHYQRQMKRGTTELPEPPAKNSCAVGGCDRTEATSGYCSSHYQRLLKHGDPEAGGRLRPRLGANATTNDRFWSHVTKSEGCWLWDAALNTHGYGNFSDGERWVGAHRYAFESLIAAIPVGMTLDHLCHTHDPSCRDTKECSHRRCVNPEHLEVVTVAENLDRARLRSVSEVSA